MEFSAMESLRLRGSLCLRMREALRLFAIEAVDFVGGVAPKAEAATFRASRAREGPVDWAPGSAASAAGLFASIAATLCPTRPSASSQRSTRLSISSVSGSSWVILLRTKVTQACVSDRIAVLLKAALLKGRTFCELWSRCRR